MKYFIAYRHTGEDPKRLDALLAPVKLAFERRGDEIYCTFFNDASFRARGLGPHEIMYEAFQKIEEMGRLFVLLDSVDKSEGMLMEIGYCIAKKIPITIAYNRAITDSYVPHMVSSTIAYSDIDELVASIDRMVV
ncbi:MAG: hypothetical protein WBB39_02255 [Candidatus Saccharimonadales bacterium]